MTQEKLRRLLKGLAQEDVDSIMRLINQHVKEVIGEDEPIESTNASPVIRNALRGKQRKRAGL